MSSKNDLSPSGMVFALLAAQQPWRSRFFQLFGILLAFSVLSYAQVGTQHSLITQAIDESKLTVLRGNTHPLAQAQFDRGAAPPDLPMQRMLLVLKRSAEQEAALQTLLAAQQDKSSPNFHKWLMPEEFGRGFGPSEQDLQTVVSWLSSHGFDVPRISKGRTVIEFSGTAALVQQAFHTEIHKFTVNGEDHWANASDPQIPETLAPVIAGIASLHNFPLRPLHHLSGAFRRSKGTGEVTPLFTFAPPGMPTSYGLGPADFAKIYNVQPLWDSGTDGTGQTIAIVSESNINIQDVRDFRSMFGLPAKDPIIVLDGPDPGLVPGYEREADLDVQWSGAVAKGATIDLVVSQSTETTSGIDLSALYIVDNNVAPVTSVSYATCERFLSSLNTFWNTIWEQAASQGITVTVASGDTGSDSCDMTVPDLFGVALRGLSVNGLASTPFNVALGGTDFNDYGNQSTYWNATNDSVMGESAKSYIPEMPWNDTCVDNGGCPIETTPQQSPFAFTLTAAGGGASQLYAKPAWQTGVGVPSDAARDIPDVSLFSGVRSSFYIVCEVDFSKNFGGTSCDLNSPYVDFLGIGGTSAAAPTFAGIMALVNQQTGSRQGNANYVLYPLAAESGARCTSDVTAVGNSSCTLYDINVSSGGGNTNISVPCRGGSPNCSNTTTGTGGDQFFGILVEPNSSTPAWPNTAGYDLASGLGSVNAANLVKNWNSVSFSTTSTTLSLSTTPATNPVMLTHGQPVNVNVQVTSSSGTPTGTVSLIGGSATSSGIATLPLTSGAFSGLTSMLPGGTYGVSAHFAGDGSFGASDSTPPVQVTVNPENSQTQLAILPLTVVPASWCPLMNATTLPYGCLQALRVNVLNASGTPCSSTGVPQFSCPTGNVTVSVNGQPLGAGTYALNALGYTDALDGLLGSSQLAGGSYNLNLSYAGDASYNTSSQTVPMTITKAASATGVTSGPGPFPAGQPFTFSVGAGINGLGAAPTGTVQVSNGSTAIAGPVPCNGTPNILGGSIALGGCSAGISVTLSGPATLTAQYSGDNNYAGSTSAPFAVSVSYPTTTALTASALTVNAGTSVTLTAIVDGQRTPAPTGQVAFLGPNNVSLPGTVTYQTVTDSKGFPALQATLTYIPPSTEAVFAAYNGDSNYQGSQSQSIQIVVQVPDFSLAANPASATVIARNSATYTLSVTGTNGFAGTVNVTCSLPAAAVACSANPPSVASGSPTTIMVSTTSHQLTLPTAYARRFGPLLLVVVVLALALLAFGSSVPRLRWATSILFVVTLFVVFHAAGCAGGSTGGGSTGPPMLHGTQPGNYTVTITGTSGSLTHTTSVSLTVQ